jgi:hypothetical protein
MARTAAPSLNPRQQAFLDTLLVNGGNASAAYRAVYGDKRNAAAVNTAASKLRHHPLIAPRLAEVATHNARAVAAAVDRYGITADHIADALARLAFTEVRQVAVWRTEPKTEDGPARQMLKVIDSDQIDPDAHQAISEVRIDDKGRITVKLYNKSEALMNLARLKGWVADKPAEPNQLVMLKIER